MGPEEIVRLAAEKAASDLGLEFWDAEVGGAQGRPRVVVYADKPGGIGLDDLEGLSRTIQEILDRTPPFPGSYQLDVASPGPERRLRSLDDVRRFLGETAVVRLRTPVDGRRRLSGRIVAVETTTLVVEGDDGRVHRVPWTDVQRANLRL